MLARSPPPCLLRLSPMGGRAAGRPDFQHRVGGRIQRLHRTSACGVGGVTSQMRVLETSGRGVFRKGAPGEGAVWLVL